MIDKTKGTDGRVYGGSPDLIHVEDGTRARLGVEVARELNTRIRFRAVRSGVRTPQEAVDQKLCPGCYMVVLFNAAVHLAQANGQSLSELGNSLADAFAQLAQGGPEAIEEIEIKLDPCGI